MASLRFLFATLGVFLACTSLASAEQFALLNYESKPDQPVRREGIAIMDIDPDSQDFGKILMEIPLPSDLVAHHIFFNRDKSKAYITALGKSILHVVGGTGSYANARGTVTFRYTSETTAALDVQLR